MSRFFCVLLIVVLFSMPAVAETFTVDAVVVSYGTTSWGDVSVEVVDEEGNVLAYFVDLEEHVRIGDVITLTIYTFDFNEEEYEVVDAVRIAHLSATETANWICH